MNDYAHIQDLIENDFDSFVSRQQHMSLIQEGFIYDGNIIGRRDSITDEIEMLETLFTEPPVVMEVIREQYRN
jgi:hypothetical protein